MLKVLHTTNTAIALALLAPHLNVPTEPCDVVRPATPPPAPDADILASAELQYVEQQLFRAFDVKPETLRQITAQRLPQTYAIAPQYAEPPRRRSKRGQRQSSEKRTWYQR